jgi:hypothetical protein
MPDPEPATVSDIVITQDQRQAAHELSKATQGDPAEAVTILMVLAERTPCDECSHFWWGVAAAITHDVMVAINQTRGASPSAPLKHLHPDETPETTRH